LKNQIHNLSHLFLSVTLSLAVTYCGKTNFDKGSVASGNAAVVQTPSSNDRDVEENDQEAMVASEPVSVGGAFLACTLATAQSTSEEAAVQCEFSSRDVGSRQAQDLLYGFSTGANRAQASALVPAREEFINDGARQVWVWHFYFQKSGIQDGWIYVDIQDRARTSDAIIKSDVAISTATPAPAPTPTPTATPTTATAPSMFRFNSGAQKLGDDGAGVAVEAGCVGIDNVNIAMARSRSYAVTFTTETSLNIVFSNLCGVGTARPIPMVRLRRRRSGMQIMEPSSNSPWPAKPSLPIHPRKFLRGFIVSSLARLLVTEPSMTSLIPTL
jgi:hypothetical protein